MKDELRKLEDDLQDWRSALWGNISLRERDRIEEKIFSLEMEISKLDEILRMTEK